MLRLGHKLFINHAQLCGRKFHLSRCTMALKPFVLADIGEGIAEVELMQWFVKQGDKIKAFDKICEVQSDKATVEITSRFDGTVVVVHHKEGDIVKVGDALVDIETVDVESPSLGTNPPVSATPSLLQTTAPSTPIAKGIIPSKPFLLADIGEGIAEVELMAWYVKVGDSVKAFDKICEVQSDKATVEITSRYDGVITAVHHAEGGIVKVGEPLVDIQQAGSGVTEQATSEGVVAVAPVAAAATHFSSDNFVSNSGKVLTTPAVRKLAKENNIDLNRVKGTGPKGRILKEDILNVIKNGASALQPPVQQQTQQPSSPVPAAPVQVASMYAPSTTTVPAPSSSPSAKTFAAAGDTKVPIRGIQRMMVKSMSEALKVPHLTYCEEVSMDNLIRVRKELKTALDRSGDKVKMSFMPLIIKATSLALLEYPHLNASINAEVTEVTYHGDHNMGIAMDTPKGLIVPVLKQVQNKSAIEIARELTELQILATKGGLTEAHLSGGTFSLSNIGSIGGTYMRPVIVVPQVMIGAFGKFQTLPKYLDSFGNPASTDDIYDGKAVVAPSTIMTVSWSADHRVVDGASVARFSNLWKSYLENPAVMLGGMR